MTVLFRIGEHGEGTDYNNYPSMFHLSYIYMYFNVYICACPGVSSIVMMIFKIPIFEKKTKCIFPNKRANKRLVYNCMYSGERVPLNEPQVKYWQVSRENGWD